MEAHMKLNFLKVLNNQSNNPEEIAEQIVGLELKQIEYEKQRDLLRTQTKELRQRKLCGEAITNDQIKEADRKAENAGLDLEAVTESLAKLEERLRAAYESIRDNGNTVGGQRLNAILPECNKLNEELALAKAKVLVLAEQLWGNVTAQHKLRNGYAFHNDDKTDHIMNEEVEKLRASVKQPTYYMKYSEAQNYSSWTARMDIDYEIDNILNKHRRNLGVPVKETV